MDMRRARGMRKVRPHSPRGRTFAARGTYEGDGGRQTRGADLDKLTPGVFGVYSM